MVLHIIIVWQMKYNLFYFQAVTTIIISGHEYFHDHEISCFLNVLAQLGVDRQHLRVAYKSEGQDGNRVGCLQNNQSNWNYTRPILISHSEAVSQLCHHTEIRCCLETLFPSTY